MLMVPILFLGFFARESLAEGGSGWRRHTIDGSARGADGVRMIDVNGDGRLDVVTGWEEAGVVRVCFQPDRSEVRMPWPGVTVGLAASPEDAFGVDLDGDSKVDIVSCHEGKEKAVWVHWQRQATDQWSSQMIPCTKGVTRWMYAISMQVDGRDGPDLIVGSKSSGTNAEDGQIAWLQSPPNPRMVEHWKLHPITKAGWVMSLVKSDFDRDGDLDILVTDRKGQRRGAYWLENQLDSSFRRVDLPLSDREVMFADVLPDAGSSVWVSSRAGSFSILERQGREWKVQEVANPFEVRTGKAVAVSRILRSPTNDVAVVHTSNTFAGRVGGERPGVAASRGRQIAGQWRFDPWVDVSGLEGMKFDLAEWIDVDGDGDLDILTCEERSNLGVVWYEQP